MTKQIKIETTIKNIMIAFVAENGLQDRDITSNGIRFVILGANHFHFGQVTIFHAEYGKWVADYNQAGKLGTPKHLQQISTGAWVVVK